MNLLRTVRPPVFRREEEVDALPTASNEDVEFSEALADEEDREAQRRAEDADRRAASYRGD